MNNEKNAPRNDIDDPNQDWQWKELQQNLEKQKPATDDSEKIVEGDEVASAAKVETARVMRKILSGI